jgi:hypothetical protein
MAKRHYKDEFLDIGFTFITECGIAKGMCIICGEVMSKK